MSATFDAAALTDSGLEELLRDLERQERSLSRRRSQLHDRLDLAHAGGVADPAAGPQVEALYRKEHELSGARRELQQRIDVLRAERARRQRSAS